MIRADDLSAEESRFLDDPQTQVECCLHTIDNCLSFIRQTLNENPQIAAIYVEDLQEIAAEISLTVKAN